MMTVIMTNENVEIFQRVVLMMIDEDNVFRFQRESLDLGHFFTIYQDAFW